MNMKYMIIFYFKILFDFTAQFKESKADEFADFITFNL